MPSSDEKQIMEALEQQFPRCSKVAVIAFPPKDYAWNERMTATCGREGEVRAHYWDRTILVRFDSLTAYWYKPEWLTKNCSPNPDDFLRKQLDNNLKSIFGR